MAVTHAYTLLIVESPTVARIIRHFDLPYLDAVATGGFCWIPEYDPARNRLSYRADPDKRDLRRSLKEQAGWASRVIIATDEDAAGRFIAFTLARHLRQHQLMRASLTGLSPSAIRQMLEEARPYQPDEPRRLRNRFMLHQALRQANVFWEQLALLSFFFDTRPRHTFRDARGNRYLAKEAQQVSFRSKRLLVPASQNLELYRRRRPLSTASALGLASDAFPGHSFAQLQEHLNRLFTTAPEALGQGLISYPRTEAHGFFAATWQQMERAWLERHDLGSLRPPVIRDRLPPVAPHESIHPLVMKHDPAMVRPHVRKDAHTLYHRLYAYHLDYLHMPELLDGASRADESGNLYLDSSGGGPNRDIEVTPLFDIASLLDFLVENGGLRPSRIGSTFDQLRVEQWVRTENDRVEPGSEAFRYLSRIRDVKTVTQCVNRLREIAEEPDPDPSALRQLLNEILM